MAELTRVQQSTLIKLYRDHSVLWDASLPAYKHQIVRNRALTVIQTDFEAQWGIRLEINDIKTKLQSFRTCISREMSKRDRAMKSGACLDDDYIPTYKHWHELEFLTKVIRKRDPNFSLVPSQCSVPQASPASPVRDSYLWVMPAPPDTDCQTTEKQDDPGEDFHVTVKLEPEEDTEETVPETQARLSSPPSWPPATSASPLLSANKRKEMDEAAPDSTEQCRLKKCFRTESPVAVTATEDPYSIWAKNLVETLKKINSKNKRTRLQIQLTRLVEDELLKQIEEEEGDAF